MSAMDQQSVQDVGFYGDHSPPSPHDTFGNPNSSMQNPNHPPQDHSSASAMPQNMAQYAGIHGAGNLNFFQMPENSASNSAGMTQNNQSAGSNTSQNSAQAQMQAQQEGGNINFMNPFQGNSSAYGMPFNPVQGYPQNMMRSSQGNVGMAAFVPQNFPMNNDVSNNDNQAANMMRNGMMPVNFMPQGHMMQPVMMAPFFPNMPQPNQNPQNSMQASGATSDNTSPIQPQSTDQFNRQAGSMSSPQHQDATQPFSPQARSRTHSRHNSLSQARQPSISSQSPFQQQQASQSFSQAMSQQFSNQSANKDGFSNNFSLTKSNQGQNAPVPVRHPQTSYKNAYSSTGFDLLTVLMRVATRKDPEINIGAVDLSCAFVVCDVAEHDCPIIYCSENFERLTGYTKHEILGRNCRFLQAPNGKVQSGIKRAYSDDDSVLFLKNKITARKEGQISLINYRKGGQPFMNLLTMIPVTYEHSNETQYYVGFQVDLVEQPGSVTNKNPDGTYTINYQRGLTMPRYVFSSSDRPNSSLESGQTISRDEVSTVLSTIGSGESDLSKKIWDKVLLENTDDVIFVLSLKGLFLYLSPASKKVLEYDPSELMGTALSSVCHPSDIVPVTRELKDTTTAASVSIVFRFRRKNSGYMWFEGHGALHTEQGKGRKSIVLIGRERPVYTLSKLDILSAGGIGENEVWTKLSTSGMFLYVSSSIRSILDKQPEELVGTSIQALMRSDSRADFARILEVARAGRRAQTRHELLNRRGQVLQAFSSVYPGDAVEGHKPTFFVAQTRLLKYSRPTAAPTSTQAQRPQSLSKPERETSFSLPQPTAGSNAGDPVGASTPNPNQPLRSFGRTNSTASQSGRPTAAAAQPAASPTKYMSTFEAVTTYAGQDSLPLGSQDQALADDSNLFDELKTTRSTSWQYELRQMEKRNRLLAEELQALLAARKKRKRRKGTGSVEKDCANCHTKTTPEWRRGPSGNRDLCNSCGLRWAKQQGRISPRTTSAKSAASAAGGGGSPKHADGGIQGPNQEQQTRQQNQVPSSPGKRSPPDDGEVIPHNVRVEGGASGGGDRRESHRNSFSGPTGGGHRGSISGVTGGTNTYRHSIASLPPGFNPNPQLGAATQSIDETLAGAGAAGGTDPTSFPAGNNQRSHDRTPPKAHFLQHKRAELMAQTPSASSGSGSGSSSAGVGGSGWGGLGGGGGSRRSGSVSGPNGGGFGGEGYSSGGGGSSGTGTPMGFGDGGADETSAPRGVKAAKMEQRGSISPTMRRSDSSSFAIPTKIEEEDAG